MIANAAASRLDLRAEPSPLNQHEEAAQSNSQQLKSKIMKIGGKLPRMSVSGGNAASAEGKKMTSLISVSMAIFVSDSSADLSGIL